MILVYDTETSGLVMNDKPAEHAAQPHLVQIGLLLCDDDGTERSTCELIVYPEGYTIPDRAAAVHGITTEIAKRCGVPLRVAVALFANFRAVATEIVAFNMDFDDLVMRAAIHRVGVKPSNPGPDKKTCCMRMATPVLNLPPTAKMKAVGFLKNKPPNLTEAYKFFNDGVGFAGAHGALADARACSRVFFEMKKRGIVQDVRPQE